MNVYKVNDAYKDIAQYAARENLQFVVKLCSASLVNIFNKEIPNDAGCIGYNDKVPIFWEPTPVTYTIKESDVIAYRSKEQHQCHNSDSDDESLSVVGLKDNPMMNTVLAPGFGSYNLQLQFQTISDGKLVINRQSSPTHSLVAFGQSVDEIEMFWEHIKLKNPERSVTPARRILEWNPRQGCYSYMDVMCPIVQRSDLHGIDEHFETVKHDVKIMGERRDVLERMGIVNGHNYLLYGPPGTGKSSFVKALSMELNASIYCVKLKNVSVSDYSKALCPRANGLCIVLVEDFDRHMDNNGKDISELLNALDGIYPAYNVLRFFSANYPEKAMKDVAINSRMRRKLYFGKPKEDDIVDNLTNIFPGYANGETLQQFVGMVNERGYTLRTVNMYLSRFVFDDDPIKEAIARADEWHKELKAAQGPDDQSVKADDQPAKPAKADGPVRGPDGPVPGHISKPNSTLAHNRGSGNDQGQRRGRGRGQGQERGAIRSRGSGNGPARGRGQGQSSGAFKTCGTGRGSHAPLDITSKEQWPGLSGAK